MAHRPVVETREALVRAALTVVARDGVQAATTRAIAAEAGLPLASFHYAFSSRDELMAEVVRYAVGREVEAISPTYEDVVLDPDHVPTVLEHAELAFRNYVDSLKADPDREKAMLTLTFWALRTPELAELARVQYAHYDAVARAALDAVTALTGARWRMSIEDMSRFLVAVTDGMTVSWLIYRDDEQIDRFALAAARGLAAMAVLPGQPDYDALPDPFVAAAFEGSAQ